MGVRVGHADHADQNHGLGIGNEVQGLAEIGLLRHKFHVENRQEEFRKIARFSPCLIFFLLRLFGERDPRDRRDFGHA